MKNFIFIVLVILTSGCSAISRRWEYHDLMKPVIADKLKNPNLIVDGKPEPELPDEDVNEETLGGIDSNNDGIRDDVEIWINRTESDDLKRKALKKVARLLQKIILDDSYNLYTSNKIDKNTFYKIVQKRAYEEFEASQCMYYSVGTSANYELRKNIKALNYNNTGRYDYSLKNQFAVSRVVTNRPEDNSLMERKDYCNN